jgi:hypothetical protein
MKRTVFVVFLDKIVQNLFGREEDAYKYLFKSCYKKKRSDLTKGWKENFEMLDASTPREHLFYIVEFEVSFD